MSTKNKKVPDFNDYQKVQDFLQEYCPNLERSFLVSGGKLLLATANNFIPNKPYEFFARGIAYRTAINSVAFGNLLRASEKNKSEGGTDIIDYDNVPNDEYLDILNAELKLYIDAIENPSIENIEPPKSPIIIPSKTLH
jgi:hypothetical protein